MKLSKTKENKVTDTSYNYQISNEPSQKIFLKEKFQILNF